jgi:hypothetical protein
MNSVGRYKKPALVQVVDQNFSMAPLSVAKMDNGLLVPFQNSKKRLYEEDE